jgi:hypothetical protein
MSDIYLSLTETPAVVTLSQPVISGALSSTVTVANTVTVALDANSLSALEQVTVTVGAAVSVSNFPATQTVAGTVTVGNTVTIAGTVTPSGFTSIRVAGNDMQGVSYPLPVNYRQDNGAGSISLSVPVFLTTGQSGLGVTTANPLQVAGSVTAAGTVTVGNTVTVAGTVTANPTGTQTVAGTVTASLANVVADDLFHGVPHVRVNGGYGVGVELAGIDYLGTNISIFEGGGIPVYPRDNTGENAPFPVAGTVTVGNLPSGALTTRFGSVTTAGTAQLTSAVTNANRKYLLLQNISTGSVTVGVGFVPTTTQGIALAAGAGLTFDAFCPTGAVHWLGATTGAAFTILEG